MISFIVVVLFFTINIEAQNIERKELDLQLAYNRIISDKSSENWIKYFELFPSTFEKFDSIFGYRNYQEGTLYDMYQQYIDLFFKAKDFVKGDVFYDKIIRLAKDGAWDADAVSLFQSSIVNFVINASTYPQERMLFLEVLSSFSDTDITNFWRFYFDDLYPDCYGDKYKKTISALQGFERLLLIINEIYKTICEK